LNLETRDPVIDPRDTEMARPRALPTVLIADVFTEQPEVRRATASGAAVHHQVGFVASPCGSGAAASP
jgi:hypothetical protein